MSLHFSTRMCFPYLISPLVDDWHVDIINKHSHLFACRRAECVSHAFVDITLYGSLQWDIMVYKISICSTVIRIVGQ